MTCTKCSSNNNPALFGCVTKSSINFCEVVNEDDPLKCDACMDGYSLNYNNTVCLDCRSLTPGCT